MSSSTTATTAKPLAFGSDSIHPTDQPIHASPSDGWHGLVAPTGTAFPPSPGRYHLYIGLFCPFAHRANLVRHLKGLTDAIDISVVKPYPKGNDQGWPGWKFVEPGVDEYEGATEDKLFGSRYLHEVYFRADRVYEGRYSVPLLWDRVGQTVVCNESAEMLRWLGSAFEGIVKDEDARRLDLYPEALRGRIDEVTEWMQRDLNTGVYKAGFAKDQEAYDRNVVPVFAALNELERIIHENGGPYILGKELTELDIRAYATVVRFDPVYVQHFKCNLGTIRADYPVINEWLKNLYHNVPGFKETTDFRHIKENYTKSHGDINPLAITPRGPYPDIQTGVNLKFRSLKPGSIDHPEVLEYQKRISRGE